VGRKRIGKERSQRREQEKGVEGKGVEMNRHKVGKERRREKWSAGSTERGRGIVGGGRGEDEGKRTGENECGMGGKGDIGGGKKGKREGGGVEKGSDRKKRRM